MIGRPWSRGPFAIGGDDSTVNANHWAEARPFEVVAIPSLLLYAFLSRKVRRMLDDMEKIAMSFVNRLVAAGEPEDTLPKAAGGEAG